MITLGLTNIKNIVRGSTQIQKVYRGTSIIWENWKQLTGTILNATYSQTSGLGTKTATSVLLENGIKILSGTCTFYIKNNDSNEKGYLWSIDGLVGGSWVVIKNGRRVVGGLSSSTFKETFNGVTDTIYNQVRYSIEMKHNGSIDGKVTSWIQRGN